jgi:molybdenum-dependent DNA-binding transcriptional regulator ModE
VDAQQVKDAIEKGGSIRKAAKLLGKPHTSIQHFLKTHGYVVVKKATIVPKETA